jgi:hypothetical protein
MKPIDCFGASPARVRSGAWADTPIVTDIVSAIAMRDCFIEPPAALVRPRGINGKGP